MSHIKIKFQDFKLLPLMTIITVLVQVVLIHTFQVTAAVDILEKAHFDLIQSFPSHKTMLILAMLAVVLVKRQ